MTNDQSLNAQCNLVQQKSPVKVAVVINFLTTYREAFYKDLLSRKDLEVTIYCHYPPAHLNLRSIHDNFKNNVVIVDGRFYFGEKIVVSHLPFKKLINDYDVVYVEGNPRYISFAALATLLEVKKKNVVLWTMVHSYRNAKLGHFFRVAWYRFFRKLLVYTEKEVAYLKSLGFKSQVVAINNAIDTTEIFKTIAQSSTAQLESCLKANELDGRQIILSCARLEPKNKFELVISALPEVVRHHPSVLWCVIGGGAEHDRLMSLAKAAGVDQHVKFLGPIYNEENLAPWFLNARLLVHPGAIGLTLLHAYAYGVPVVTHDDDRTHGPEFAAFIDGECHCAFKKDSVSDLTRAMLALLADENQSRKVGNAGRHVVATHYDMPGMVKRFLSLASVSASQ